MPVFSFLCPAGHETAWIGVHANRPETVPCDDCDEAARYSIAATAMPYPKAPTVEKQAVTVRGSTPRFGLLTWACIDCNVTFQEVLDREEEDAARANGRPCPKCAKPAKWIPSWSVDRFPETIHGGYFDRGLGRWVKSPAHRRDLCKEMNVEPIEGDWDVDREFSREDTTREKEEADYAAYVDECEHSPKYAGVRRARDLGIL